MFKEFLVKAVKKHQSESEYLTQFNKSVKFRSMEAIENGTVKCWDGTILTKYKVSFTFKPEHKYDNNIVWYQFNQYSNGDYGFYYDGTSYDFKNIK